MIFNFSVLPFARALANIRNFIKRYFSVFLHSLCLSITVISLPMLAFEQTIYATTIIPINRSYQKITVKGQTNHSPPLSSIKNSWMAYKAPRHYFSSALTRLPVLSDGAMALPSNANNFHSGLTATVNPRTGNASFSMKIAGTIYNRGHSQRDLLLLYAGGSVEGGPDTFGLGPHWRWNVGIERPSSSEEAGHMTTDLVTGDGHTFTMESDRNPLGQTLWKPLRHKLHDVIITGSPGNWTLTLPTGIREHIKNGYEDWEETPEGQKVWFYYSQTGPYDKTRSLKYICAHPLTQSQVLSAKNVCEAQGVWLTYKSDKVFVHGKNTLVLNLSKNAGIKSISSIYMPSLSSTGVSNHSKPAIVKFHYDNPGNRPWLLHSVYYPTGDNVTFLYNGESTHNTTNIKGLPTGINGSFIPVVTEKITHYSSSGTPDNHVWYHYGNSRTKEHNYTGYQGATEMRPGRDNLLDQPDSYTYRVTMDNGKVESTTTYNKYHLPIRVTRKDLIHNMVFSEEKKDYGRWKNTTFPELSPGYSMPKSTKNTIFTQTESGSINNKGKVLDKSARYDNSGRVIWKRNAWGKQTFIQYCPEQGDQHCPAMITPIPGANRPEKIVVIPPMANASSSDPDEVNVETFDYARFPVSPSFQNGTAKKQGVLLKTQSPARYFWHVKKRTFSTISGSDVSNLLPGDGLSKVSAGKINEETTYQYDNNITSHNYGELTQLTLNEPTPSLQTNDKDVFGQQRLSLKPDTGKKVTFNVIHHLDTETNTRSTTITILPDQTTPERLLKNMAVSAGGYNLGTSRYSLTTGVKISADDPLKTLHTQWVYDLWNRPVKEVVLPQNGGKKKVTTWQYIFTSKERAAVKTFPDGNQQKVIFGEGRRIVYVGHRFRYQANAPTEGPSNWITDKTLTYNTDGKPVTITSWHASDPIGDHPGKPVALTTRYGYDSLNRPVWVKRPDGVITITARDDANLREIVYKMATGHGEKTGPFLKVTDANLLGKPVSVYIFPLDSFIKKHNAPLYPEKLQKQLQALLGAALPVSSLTKRESLGLLPLSGKNGLFNFVKNAISQGAWLTRTTFAYDIHGNRIRQTQGNGAITRWKWRIGQLKSTITPTGQVIHDEYNIEGKKVSRCVRPSQTSPYHLLGTRHYNMRGNLIWERDEYGNKIHYTYDANGRRTSKTLPASDGDSRTHVITWHYNSIGVTREDVDGQTRVKYTYDPLTWRLTDKEDHVSHLHYQYSADTGQLIGIIRKAPVTLTPANGIHYPAGKEIIRYDRYNQPTLYTDREGNHFFQIHDRLGRVTQYRVKLAGHLASTLLKAVVYNDFSKPVQINYGMKIKRQFIYNSMGQVAATIDSKTSSVLQIMRYTYDPDTGNLLTQTRTEGKLSATQTFTYDTGNNLETMTCHATGQPSVASALCPRDTDLSGSGLTIPPFIVSQHYDFDHWNNISRVTEALKTNKGENVIKITRYNYADTNSDEKIPDTYDPHRMLAMNTTWSTSGYSTKPLILTYDTMGRIIKDAAGNRLHYNAFGQQDRFENRQTGETTHYAYDSDGHQIATQSFNAKGQALQSPLYLFYSGNSVSSQLQKDQRGTTHTATELGGVARCEDGHIKRWYLHDYRRDVVASFDNHGRQLQDNLYSPYGMSYDRLNSQNQALPKALKIANSDLILQRHLPGFDGQMSDPATGYQFLGSGYRAYNPVYRHFMAMDSISPFTLVDGYGFGNNNPIMNTDPTGHMSNIISYALGGVTAAFSIGLGFLIPLAGAGLGMLSGTTIGIGIGVGAAGFISGSLQVASTAVKKKELTITSDVVNILNGFIPVVFGITSVLAGALSTVVAISKSMISPVLVVNDLVIASGVTAAASGIFNTASSSMSMAKDTAGKSIKSHKSFIMALEVLDYISMGLMAASILTDIGGYIGARVTGRIGGSTVKSKGVETVTETPDSISPKNKSITGIGGVAKTDYNNQLGSFGIMRPDEDIPGTLSRESAPSEPVNPQSSQTKASVSNATGPESNNNKELIDTFFDRENNTLYIKKEQNEGAIDRGSLIRQVGPHANDDTRIVELDDKEFTERFFQ